MKYTNKNSELVQVNLPDTNPVRWAIIRAGETKDLPISESYAKRFGLYPEGKEPVEEKSEEVVAEESSIGEVTVETKKSKKKNKGYAEKIQEIKGIGVETAKDICTLYNKEELLINALKNNYRIPLRNDIVLKLKKYYLGEN